jgi:hypothetical protein
MNQAHLSVQDPEPLRPELWLCWTSDEILASIKSLCVAGDFHYQIRTWLDFINLKRSSYTTLDDYLGAFVTDRSRSSQQDEATGSCSDAAYAIFQRSTASA